MGRPTNHLALLQKQIQCQHPIGVERVIHLLNGGIVPDLKYCIPTARRRPFRTNVESMGEYGEAYDYQCAESKPEIEFHHGWQLEGDLA